MSRKWLTFDAVSNAVGADAAVALCGELGGMTWYLPATADPAHPAAVSVGLEGMEALCEAFGPGQVTLPRLRWAGTRKPDIIHRLQQGGSCRDIAAELGVTERYVQRIRKDLGMARSGVPPSPQTG